MSAIRNVLFLCTGNSARSILGEALLNRWGAGRFTAYSAGSNPGGKVNPFALALLAEAGIATAGLRSKSWHEFEGPGAPHFDIVFTVCDSAAKEACPIWPGRPVNVHWGIADPVSIEDFREAYDILKRRITALVELPLEGLDSMSLRKKLAEIGRQ